MNATKKKPEKISAADVGAGTGIFTKCLIDAGIKRVIAVEPDDNMRNAGVDFLGTQVNFLDGSAENTTLEDSKLDLITMASSFHWADTKKALVEFNRILRPDGVFAALWNPRLTKRSIIETQIQNLLETKYQITTRISSGLSEINNNLRDVLLQDDIFRSIVYIDAIDVEVRSHEKYIGAWRSVNEIQARLGNKHFSKFLLDIERIIAPYPRIDVHYLTRAWIAVK